MMLLAYSFDSTDAPTANGTDPTATANALAEWVIEYDLDGVYELSSKVRRFDVSGPRAVWMMMRCDRTLMRWMRWMMAQQQVGS